MMDPEPGFKPTSAAYLLVSRIGANSVHSRWFGSDGPIGFDVLLSSYDPNSTVVHGPGVFFEHRPGPKVAGYAEILRAHDALLRRYQYVALFDDDVETDGESILRLFKVVDGHGFKIAQPALDHSSYFTYACLLQHNNFFLRHVNYIEMMCPIFRTDVLLDLAPVFDLGFESGIDLVWSALANAKPGDLAVVDSLPIHHGRPVGAVKSVNGFVGGRTYETDIHAILGRFGLAWLPALSLGGLRTNGRFTVSRLRMTIAAMALFRAIFIRSVGFRARAVGKYVYRMAVSPRSARVGLLSPVPLLDDTPKSLSSLTFNRTPCKDIVHP